MRKIPARLILLGNKGLAATYRRAGDQLLMKVERMASFQQLKQNSGLVRLSDGTVIKAETMHDQSKITIQSPFPIPVQGERLQEVWGRVFVGSCLADGYSIAAIWDEFNGWKLLGTLPGHTQSFCKAVSDDGSAVIGISWGSSGLPHAFIWTSREGMVSLTGDNPNFLSSFCAEISANGQVVTGNVALDVPDGSGGAFIWDRENGMRTFLTGLPDGFGSEGAGLSADGSMVAGYWGTSSSGGGAGRGGWSDGGSSGGSSELHGFIWTEATGPIDFYSSSGDPYPSFPRSLSENGLIVSGENYMAAQILQWVDGGDPSESVLEGWRFWTWGASNDGGVVVGEGRNVFNSDVRGFVCRPATGSVELLPLMPGAEWNGAYGISPDSRVVVGQTYVSGKYWGFYIQDGMDARTITGFDGSELLGVSNNTLLGIKKRR
jgi:probable HAF family extracellular repeat protein